MGTAARPESPPRTTRHRLARNHRVLRGVGVLRLRGEQGQKEENQQDQQNQGPTIEAYYLENRTFPPPESFGKDALVTSDQLYRDAEADWQGFWAHQATDLLDWYQPWQTV